MKEVLDEVVRKTLSGFNERLEAFGPNLLAMLVILAVGVLAALAVRVVVRLLLPRVGFDRFAARAGLTVVLQKGGITSPPSSVMAVALAWAVLGVFVLLAVGALNLEIAMDLVSRSFSYLPQLLIGAAILVLYGVVPTWQTEPVFGRIYAAYGGAFVVFAMLWGWGVDRKTPDLYDALGACLCLAGAAIIMWSPRI